VTPEGRLEIRIAPSSSMCMLLVLAHGLAISGVLLSAVEVYIKVAFILTVILSLIFCIRRYGVLRHPLSVVSVLFHDGVWLLTCRNGQEVPARLELPVFVVSFLVAMNFRDGRGRKFSVAIFPDAANETQLRQCRVFLKYHPNLGGTKMVSEGSSSSSG